MNDILDYVLSRKDKLELEYEAGQCPGTLDVFEMHQLFGRIDELRMLACFLRDLIKQSNGKTNDS